MKQVFVITSDAIAERVIDAINKLDRSIPYEVTIKEYKRNRSLEQSALYWQWLTIIGNHLGESKEDIHERYKDVFLVNIYERDNPDYAEMIQSLREVWRAGMKDEAVSLRKRIVALTSTTTATTRQLSEYMDNIERDAATLSIRLPHPED